MFLAVVFLILLGLKAEIAVGCKCVAVFSADFYVKASIFDAIVAPPKLPEKNEFFVE